MTPREAQLEEPVAITFCALTHQDPHLCRGAVERAFGRGGLGLIIVKDVPGLKELRQKLLPLAPRVQALPAEVKTALERPDACYAFGYSIGREVMENEQTEDLKMSFYNNPVSEAGDVDPEMMKQHPNFVGTNVWPSEHIPELQPAFQDLGHQVVKTGQLLARHLDWSVKASGLQPQRQLADIIQHSPCHKSRLLHYIPASSSKTARPRWCGMHTDFGSLTGLVSAMYLKGGEEVGCPDPEAGLWVMNRTGSFQKVSFPPDALAFQLGQAAQVQYGGHLCATMHYVEGATGAAAESVSRNTFAVFMQPRWDEIMDAPAGAQSKDFGIGQWSPGISFGDFTEQTMKLLHPRQK